MTLRLEYQYDQFCSLLTIRKHNFQLKLNEPLLNT
jgi:hypothetical protein